MGEIFTWRETFRAERSFSCIPLFAQRQQKSVRKFMKVISSLIVLAGLLVGHVDARPDKDGGPERKKAEERGERKIDRGEEHKRGGKGWRQADADNDGKLTRSEFDTLSRIQKLPEEKRARIFNRLDKDQDGILSGEELRMLMQGPQGAGRAAMMRFRELDTDKSGGVSLAELKAGELFRKLPPEKQEILFRRLDTDGDGEITPRDKPSGRRDGPDRNRKEGRPDKESGEEKAMDERPARELSRMLKELDDNRDGSISFEEFRKSPRIRDLGEDAQEDRFEALDKNNDKKLDEADFSRP